MSKWAKKTDIMAIAIILVLCGGIAFLTYYFGVNKDVVAEIYYFDDLIKSINISNGDIESFIPTQALNVIIKTTKNSSIYFASSNCPDQVCVKAGELSRTSDFAACLPNGILIKIIGGKNKIDKVVGRGHSHE